MNVSPTAIRNSTEADTKPSSKMSIRRSRSARCPRPPSPAPDVQGEWSWARDFDSQPCSRHAGRFTGREMDLCHAVRPYLLAGEPLEDRRVVAGNDLCRAATGLLDHFEHLLELGHLVALAVPEWRVRALRDTPLRRPLHVRVPVDGVAGADEGSGVVAAPCGHGGVLRAEGVRIPG